MASSNENLRRYARRSKRTLGRILIAQDAARLPACFVQNAMIRRCRRMPFSLRPAFLAVILARFLECGHPGQKSRQFQE
jgi:hypothetical protein